MEHEEEPIIEEHEEFKDPWYKGPIKIIGGLFLILIIITMVIPFYGVKQNPEPNYVPSLEELSIPELQIPIVDSSDIRTYIQTTSEIKQLADTIVTLSCKETHKVCNAKAIFYFVQQNFNYLNDPLAFEYYKTPQESLKSNSGDCDDGSILLSSLLQSIGLRTRFVFVPGHVFVQVKIPEAITSYKDDNDWINLDSTCQGCKFGEIHYKYTEKEKVYSE
jgi:hypothetical protein